MNDLGQHTPSNNVGSTPRTRQDFSPSPTVHSNTPSPTTHPRPPTTEKPSIPWHLPHNLAHLLPQNLACLLSQPPARALPQTLSSFHLHPLSRDSASATFLKRKGPYYPFLSLSVTSKRRRERKRRDKQRWVLERRTGNNIDLKSSSSHSLVKPILGLGLRQNPCKVCGGTGGIASVSVACRGENKIGPTFA